MGCTPLCICHIGLTASGQQQTGHRPLCARVDGLYIGGTQLVLLRACDKLDTVTAAALLLSCSAASQVG